MPEGGSVLKSNVDIVEAASPPRPTRRFPVALVLGGVLLLLTGVAVGLILSSGQQRASARPTATALTTPASSAGPLPDVNGISCDALESTVVHMHIHLAIFIDGAEQQIPFGVGIGQPWQVSDTARGPFVEDGSCFYWIHTHTDDGVLHIESPVRRRFTLGDFFAIWQVPLSSAQVGPGVGQVISYVNGQRSNTNPADIPLLPHERIQLNVGTDVPPYQFDFAPGD